MTNQNKHTSTRCPKCGHECIVDKVSIICPNCDYVRMKEVDWKDNAITCPSCKNKAKVYHHRPNAKTFVCDQCNTIGRYIDAHSVESKRYDRKSIVGKKLSWLFEVPCKQWLKKDEPAIHKKYCAKCDIRKVCNEHSEEIYRFCDKKNIDIYMTEDFIEVVHK